MNPLYQRFSPSPQAAAPSAPEGPCHAGTPQGHFRRRTRRQPLGNRQADAASGHARPCHGDLDLFQRPQIAGHAASESAAQPAFARPTAPHRRRRSRAATRRPPHHQRRRRAAQSQHAAEPDQFRQGRRTDARGRQGALQGRADRRHRRRQRARGVRGAGEGPRRLRDAADGVRRRGGVEARRARRQRDLSEKRVHLLRYLRSSEAAFRRRRARLHAGCARARAALSDVADRARSDGDQRLDRGARHQWALYRLHLDAGAVFLARHFSENPRRALEQAAFRRRHGRRRFWRQGRYPDRAAVDPRRDADGAAGALHVRPRGGDAIRLAARRRAHLRQGRRRPRRPDSRAQAARLFRQRRLYPAFELRRRQMRGASARTVYGPERPRRPLLRLHQSGAGDGNARLRRHRGRFRVGMSDGQTRPPRRHGPDGIPHPQRLSRRRHEGASARSAQHRADRMRPGRR